jgi:hypothetical protein
MILSLRQFIPDSRIVVLCVDNETRERLGGLRLENVILLFIEEVLDEKILKLRNERTLAEFCWTLTPIALEEGLRYSQNGVVTYVDADLYFFSSPQVIIDKISKSGKSITITPHDFSPHLSDLISFGRFCVQWITIVDDEHGRRCVETYKRQCLDWCHAFVDQGRFGDQKYLDAWPELYKDHLFILEPAFGFAAPWNMSKHIISSGENQRYFTQNRELIFFHFHQFKIFRNSRFFWCSRSYGQLSAGARSMYKFYESAVLSARLKLGTQYAADLESVSWFTHLLSRTVRDYFSVSIKNIVKRTLVYIKSR